MDEYEKNMKKKKKSKIIDVLTWIGIIIMFLLPLVGPAISAIHQIQIQQELYGVWSQHIHIWGLYDLWDFTLLGYIPLVILLER